MSRLTVDSVALESYPHKECLDRWLRSIAYEVFAHVLPLDGQRAEFTRSFVQIFPRPKEIPTGGHTHGLYLLIARRTFDEFKKRFVEKLNDISEAAHAKNVDRSDLPLLAPGSKELEKITDDSGVRPPNRRRSLKRIDRRKALIARWKAENLGLGARDICRKLDAKIESLHWSSRIEFAPLENWTKVTKRRTWIEVYDDSMTHKKVKNWINKIPRLRTR